MEIIGQANQIITDYRAQGFDLTLRQLYYQFVSRDIIPNRDKEYKRLGSIINDARLAGLIDWEAIVDRTRNLRTLAHWDSPADIVDAVSRQFRVDKWEGQDVRPEVWIEKDALVGVIQRVCERNDVPYFSCRGYTSQSEMWVAAQRLIGHINDGQTPVIIHLGDHDPSGIDMTRDITDRLSMFLEHEGHDAMDVRRIALNMDQIDEYNPPPNPAKLSDSRSTSYVQEYGDDSWELDALDPAVMARLIERTIHGVRDEALWNAKVEQDREGRRLLSTISERWDDIVGNLEDEVYDE